MSFLICISSTFAVAFLLFRNKKYTIPFNKITLSIICLEFFATSITAFMSLYLEAPLNFFFQPGTHLYVALENLLTIAPIEEFAKFFTISLATSKLTKLRCSNDLMPYFILSACTFSAIESILYLFVYNRDLTLALMRCFISAPCHIIYSSIFAFFYTCYLDEDRPRKSLCFEGLFFASLFHGFMNYCLSYSTYTASLLSLVAGSIILIFYYIIGFTLIKRHYNKSSTTQNSKYLIYITSLLIMIFLVLLILFG